MKTYTSRYGNEYTDEDIRQQKQEEDSQKEYWNEFFTEQKRKEGIIVSGLQTKYGFSESGAKATIKLIKSVVLPDGSHPLEHANFATEEMKQGAFNALKFYNK